MPFVIGLNHNTASIQLREKLAVAPHRLGEMISWVKGRAPIEEVVVLSTCNRMEIYARASNRLEAKERLIQAMRDHASAPELEPHLYYLEGEKTVSHLFRVASGLDSMVTGENEILSQVKQAYLASQQNGSTGKMLNVLFQRSLYVGKRVRSETGLSQGAGSVASVAVAMAERIFGRLRDRCVMIFGAGEMAEMTARLLLTQKVRAVIVANRTYEKASLLARQFGGRAVHFEEGFREMEEADIVICSTSAPRPIILAGPVEELMRRRQGRSLFFIDTAVPRDVDPAVNAIDNVYLFDLDDLQKIVQENVSRRRQEIALAERIVEEETHEFTRWLRAHRAGLAMGLRHRHASAPPLPSPAPEP